MAIIDQSGSFESSIFNNDTKSAGAHLSQAAPPNGPIMPTSTAGEKSSEPSDNPAVTYPEGGARAWLVTFGSFCGMLACFGFMNTCGTYQAYISTHQLAGIDDSQIGWIFSLYTFLAFFGGILLGPFFDMKGPRLLIALGSVSLLLGTFTLAESTQYWHFMLTYGVLCGLGTSLIFTPAVASVAHFFARRRGLATGLAATGGSVGGVIFPLMLPALFNSIGFAWATRIMGFIYVFLLIVANILVRDRLPHVKDPPLSSFMPDFKIFLDGRGEFALTTAGVFAIEWGLFVPLTYLASWAIDTEVGSAQFSYQLIAILNAASFFGRWLPGLLADHIGRFNTIILASLMCLIGLLGFWLPGSIPGGKNEGSIALAVIFAMLFGFGSGSGISLTPVCVGQLCKTEDYGRYYATCYTIVSLSGLTGVPIAGALLTRCGGEYTGLLAFTASCYAFGIVAFTWARVLQVGPHLMRVC